MINLSFDQRIISIGNIKMINPITLILFMFLISFPISAFEIYNSKKIDLELEFLIGIDYSYQATLLPGRGGFELTNSKITFEGEYQDDLSFALSVDFSNIGVNYESISLLDNAYIQYKFHDFFRLRTGRFKIPFGVENTFGTQSRPYIYHCEASDLIDPGRSQGLRISGKKLFNYFSYSLGVFNSSGIIFLENETGHHDFSGLFNFKKDFFDLGYSILYSTNETFSQSIYIKFDVGLKDHIIFEFFSEYQEQRYFHYHWNHSVFTFAALRINDIQPVIYFDYFNDRVGYDGVEDKWILGLGFNSYFLKDRLKLMIDLHTNYLYSLESSYNSKFYDHKLTLKLLMEL